MQVSETYFRSRALALYRLDFFRIRFRRAGILVQSQIMTQLAYRIGIRNNLVAILAKREGYRPSRFEGSAASVFNLNPAMPCPCAQFRSEWGWALQNFESAESGEFRTRIRRFCQTFESEIFLAVIRYCVITDACCWTRSPVMIQLERLRAVTVNTVHSLGNRPSF